MNDFEMVSELVAKTGASFEEAKNAYEACGKNMLDAAVMLEKNRKIPVYSYDGKGYEKTGSGFSEKLKSAGKKAGEFFEKLCANTLKVSGKKEYFSMPLLAAVLLLVFLWEVVFPAVIISVLFGICYTLTGPDFKEDITLGITRNCTGENDNGFFGK